MYLLFLYEERKMHRDDSDLRCIIFFRIRGRLRRQFVSGAGGAFDRYDRCIEMAISGASLHPYQELASSPSRFGSWWVHSTAMTDA
jgi:hypothetical protein